MTIGRPTEYTPELGERILQLMTEGLSLAAAAGECDVHRQRVYDWVKKHDDFADTIGLAKSKRQAFLERRLLGAKEGPIVNSCIFALKNAGQGDWQDKQLVGSDPDNPLPAAGISVSGLSEATLREIAAMGVKS